MIKPFPKYVCKYLTLCICSVGWFVAFTVQAADDNQLAKTLLTQAELYLQQNQYELALIELSAAYEITTALEDNETGRNVLNAMATIFYQTDQLEQAERYYLALLVLDEAEEDWPAFATSLFNLGHVYGSQQKPLLAQTSFERALSLSRQQQDSAGIAYTLKALGVNGQAQGKLALAEDYLVEALSEFEALHDDQQIASVLRNLGDVEQAQGRYQQSVEYYQEALPVLALYGMDDALLRAYRGLSSSYAQLFDFEKAFIHQRTYTQLSQLQLQQQSQANLQHLQVQFETQHFADDNTRLELLSQNQELELEQRKSVQRMQLVILGFALVVVLLVVSLLLRSRQYAKHMRNLATTDELTGLLNRRAIMAFGMTEWERSERFDNPLTCLMFDIDYFKSVNDTFGHAIGDKILIRVAAVLKDTLRQTDAIGRFGGEEFLLLATETSLEQAKVLAERVRTKVEEIAHEELAGKRVTVSIGLVQKTDESSLEELIKNADLALYKAKEKGRNQVVIYDDQEQWTLVPA